jgi:glycine cleavage system aminomethyltransferase T
MSTEARIAAFRNFLGWITAAIFGGDAGRPVSLALLPVDIRET